MAGLTVVLTDGTRIEVPIEIESAGGRIQNEWIAARAAALREAADGDGAPAVDDQAPGGGDEGEE